MQGKITRIVMLLILLIPIRSFSMTDAIFIAGVSAGVFIVITLLIVIIFVISQTIEKK
jgi:hypothetical protein